MADDAVAPDGELTKPTDDTGAPDAESAGEATQSDETRPRPPMSHVKVALIAGLVGVLALAGLTAWLGYSTYQSRAAEQQRDLFLKVGRQGALNLTTIGHESAEADVQRILDSATGTFYDEFHQRAQPFVDVVKQAQSTSEGTIAEAGLESHDGEQGTVLVAVTVRTSNAGAPEQQPRAWRMRITVQEVSGEAKVSKVDFVQ